MWLNANLSYMWTVSLKLLCHVEETVTVVLHAGSQCHHEEMSTCLQEMTAIVLKTGKFFLLIEFASCCSEKMFDPLSFEV